MSDVFARPIHYGGDNAKGFEQNLKQILPAWMACGMRLMGERFVTKGTMPEAGDVGGPTALLGAHCARIATSPRQSQRPFHRRSSKGHPTDLFNGRCGDKI